MIKVKRSEEIVASGITYTQVLPGSFAWVQGIVVDTDFQVLCFVTGVQDTMVCVHRLDKRRCDPIVVDASRVSVILDPVLELLPEKDALEKVMRLLDLYVSL